MLLRVALLCLMGASVAGFGLVAWISLAPPPPAPAMADGTQASPPVPPPPVKRAVLVAAREVRPGALLQPGDLAATQVPEAEAPEGARPDTPQARAELVGAMARRALVEGQPVLPPDVLRPADHGFLAAVLAPGTRAASVGVDAVGGAAGLIWPGDRVDVVLTQQLEDPALPPGRRVLGETVLSDLRVVAVDQSLVLGATPGTDRGPETNRTVTLEATPLQVERVAVAGRLGRLSLAVRAASGPAEVGGDGETAASEAAAPLGAAPDKAGRGIAPKAGAPKDVVRRVAASSSAAGSASPPSGGADRARSGGGAPTATTWGTDVSPGLSVRGAGDTATLRLFQGSAEGKEFKFP